MRRQRLDDIWSADYRLDGSVLTRRLYQPSRRAVLEAVKTLRTAGVVQDRDDLRARWCLSIPHEDYEMLRRHPVWCELHSVDNDTSQKAWRRFLVHPDSAPYRVRDKAS